MSWTQRRRRIACLAGLSNARTMEGEVAALDTRVATVAIDSAAPPEGVR